MQRRSVAQHRGIAVAVNEDFNAPNESIECVRSFTTRALGTRNSRRRALSPPTSPIASRIALINSGKLLSFVKSEQTRRWTLP